MKFRNLRLRISFLIYFVDCILEGRDEIDNLASRSKDRSKLKFLVWSTSDVQHLRKCTLALISELWFTPKVEFTIGVGVPC